MFAKKQFNTYRVSQAHTKYQFTNSHTNMALKKFIPTVWGDFYIAIVTVIEVSVVEDESTD